MKRAIRFGIGLGLAGVLAACATDTPPARWHNLVAAAPGAPAPTAVVARTLAVAPVSVPDEVDRPQLVVRTAGGAPVRLDGERWSEPVKAQLPRALALSLAGRLPGTVVAAHDGVLVLPGARLIVEVQRFELQRDPDRAVLRAVWALRPGGAKEGGPAVPAQVFETAVAAAGPSPAALVAAMATALDQLSGRISQSVCAAAPC
jgi:uncharacterized lipoprotein YmbA